MLSTTVTTLLSKQQMNVMLSFVFRCTHPSGRKPKTGSHLTESVATIQGRYETACSSSHVRLIA